MTDLGRLCACPIRVEDSSMLSSDLGHPLPLPPSTQEIAHIDKSVHEEDSFVTQIAMIELGCRHRPGLRLSNNRAWDSGGVTNAWPFSAQVYCLLRETVALLVYSAIQRTSRMKRG